MAESAEHKFISETFLASLKDFSASRLYAYVEADRKALDFACGLDRDWHRVLAGQTLWGHSEGIAKDLLHLISEDQAAVVTYVARHTMANQRTLYDLLEHVRRSSLGNELRRLRVFWVPSDFDADDDVKRTMLRQHLDAAIANDILLNIVFGRLSAIDVRFFLANTGIEGLSLAILYRIAKHGFRNYPELSRSLGVGASTLRPRVAALVTSGFLATYTAASMYFVSSRGRVFLDICHEISTKGKQSLPVELCYILELLQIRLVPVVPEELVLDTWQLKSPEDAGTRLQREILAAAGKFDVAMDGPPYQTNPAELSSDRILLR